MPIPPRLNLVGSYFQSVPFRSNPVNTSVWMGISFGVGVSAKTTVKSPFIKLDITKIFILKDLGINKSKTEYGMIYGNGSDFIPATKTRKQESINGGHWPGINQNNY